MKVTQSAAIDRKRRRKANRQQRREGGYQIDLAVQQRRAERDMGIRATLSEITARGDAGEKQAARKAKKRLNDAKVVKEFERQGLRGFWDYSAV